MLRKELLIALAATLFISACATPEPAVNYVYVEKAPLNIELPQKPKLNNTTEFTLENSKVCTTEDMINNHMSNLVEIQGYIEKLEELLRSYREYYESK
ncbi:hypothetical protein [Synechococcus phage BUCT-ZZ01]|nr:hypothetical protein [Synechococcus phage BUCT-ZZ01]